MSEVAHRWKLMVPVVVLCTATIGVVIENATESLRGEPQKSAPRVEPDENEPAHEPEGFEIGSPQGLLPAEGPELQRAFAQLESQVGEVERLVDEIRSASNLVREMRLRQEYERVVAEVETGVEELRAEGRLSFRPYAQRIDAEILNPLELARRKLAGSGCYGRPSADSLGEVAETMRQHLVGGEPGRALALFDGIEAALERAAEDPATRPAAASIRSLAVQAGLLAEFATLSVEIQSIELDGDEPRVVIDGVSRARGDVLSTDLVVGAIQRDTVELVYKGVSVVRRY